MKKIALKLAQDYWNARKNFQFGTKTGTIAECVKSAMETPTQPAILADSGDNPTGGGTGDRAEVLNELLKQKASNVVPQELRTNPLPMPATKPMSAPW